MMDIMKITVLHGTWLDNQIVSRKKIDPIDQFVLPRIYTGIFSSTADRKFINLSATVNYNRLINSNRRSTILVINRI